MLVFARHSSGRVVHISEVRRGLACDCKCLDCGQVLLARHGEVNEHCFAHHASGEHDFAWESHLHKYAKQLIIDAGGLVVPLHPTIARHLGLAPDLAASLLRAGEVPIKAEVSLGVVRPDLLAITNGKLIEVALEVRVTHAASWLKAQAFGRLKLAALEIDLRRFPPERFSPDLVRHAVLQDPGSKHWLWPQRAAAPDSTSNVADYDREAAIPAPLPSPFCGPPRPLPAPVERTFDVESWRTAVRVTIAPEGDEGVLLTVHGMPIGRLAQTSEEMAAPQITKLLGNAIAPFVRGGSYRRSGVWFIPRHEAHAAVEALSQAAEEYLTQARQAYLQSRQQLASDLTWTPPVRPTPAPVSSKDNPYARRKG